MLRRVLLGTICATALVSAALAQSANVSTNPPAYTSGSHAQSMTPSGGLRTQPQDGAGHDVSASHPLPVTGTFTPSGTGDVNLKQVNGQTVNVGTGAAGTGTQRVTTSTDSTIGTVTTITNPVAATQSGTWTVQPGNTANTTPWLVTNSINNANAAHTECSALCANLVVKASAGYLYDFNIAADSTLSAAAWWVMIYDATAAPGDGAVTPAKCYALPSGSTSFTGAFSQGMKASTGITIGVSTTGCFTKTASTHAFIGAGYQ